MSPELVLRFVAATALAAMLLLPPTVGMDVAGTVAIAMGILEVGSALWWSGTGGETTQEEIQEH